jgi:hypothetical protein
MDRTQRCNIFEQTHLKDNFFIELPVDTVRNQCVNSNWTERLLNLSKDEAMLKACEDRSTKQFFTQLFKNDILKTSQHKSVNSKVVMGETWLYTDITVAVEGGGVVLSLVFVAAEVALLVVKKEDIAENALRSEKHRAISKFAIKNGGDEFGREITQIFMKLEAGESVTL